ncbi:hypothetical protein KR52_13390 [Synechococcus sp. KORDI-52]|nr:hypothetical protein KR52_13390 [Synechococcus sp. KORDI-52]
MERIAEFQERQEAEQPGPRACLQTQLWLHRLAI